MERGIAARIVVVSALVGCTTASDPSPSGPGIDLEFQSERDLGGRASVTARVGTQPVAITSVTCLPSDGCASTALSGGAASWVPLRTAYEIEVVAAGESTVRALTAAAPGAKIFSLPAAALAEQPFAFCLVGVAATTRTVLDLDGVEVATTSTPPCASAVFSRRGRAHLRTVLPNGFELGGADVPVHDHDEPDAVHEVLDQRCPDQTDAFFARSAGGQWNVILGATVAFSDGSSFAAPIEAVYHDDPSSASASGLGSLTLSFDGPPSAGARIDVTAGDRSTSFTRPVRVETVARCR